jgi:hypothetical protein
LLTGVSGAVLVGRAPGTEGSALNEVGTAVRGGAPLEGELLRVAGTVDVPCAPEPVVVAPAAEPLTPVVVWSGSDAAPLVFFEHEIRATTRARQAEATRTVKITRAGQ